MVARTLGEYEVIVESSGRAALDRLLGAGEAFDLVLCDLLMPEMNGIEVHAALVRAAPALAARMVFMTGSTFAEGVRAFLESVPNRRLGKPFGVHDLRATCAAVIAEYAAE